MRPVIITSLGTVLTILLALVTILSLLGLLPWATRAELEIERLRVQTSMGNIERSLNRIETRIDQALMSRPRP